VTVNVVAIAGSLRQGSYNRRLLRAAAGLAPDGVAVTQASLHGIPLYDEDREAVDAGGAAVARLRGAVSEADVLLLATPEYNQSVPGVLKNGIDWLSRPAPGRVLDGKPAGVMGATPGPWGTRYAQRELRHVLTATGCVVMGTPMVFVRNASEVFDGDWLVDQAAAERVAEFVAELRSWTRGVLGPRDDARAAVPSGATIEGAAPDGRSQ
jgi:chromate reductase